MNYKFVKVTTYYKDYLRQYYAKNKNIVSKSYKEQFNHLMLDSFAWADAFQRNFAKIGIEAYDIIGNAEPLQNAWAKEYNINKNGFGLVIAQIQMIKPEIVFVQDPISFNGAWVKMLREKVPSIKKVIGHLCSPFNESQLVLFKNFDFMITCAKYFLEEFTKAGLKTYHINHAFDESILKRINTFKDKSLKSDLLFIGSLIPSNDMHNFRTTVIERLLDTNLNIGLYAKLSHDDLALLLSKQIGYLFTKSFVKLGLKEFVNSISILKKFVSLNELPHNISYSGKLITASKGPLYGLAMYNKLANANAVLNIHGGVGGARYAANMRLFEVTGVGTCLVTDWKENLDELFLPDDEVVTFKTVEECIEKVKWLKENPIERQKIAKAGQKRTLKYHTFEIRVKQLDEIIRKELVNL